MAERELLNGERWDSMLPRRSVAIACGGIKLMVFIGGTIFLYSNEIRDEKVKKM